MFTERQICGRCRITHYSKFKNCERCRAACLEYHHKKKADPIEWSRLAVKQKKYRLRKHSDPAEHARNKASQAKWRALNQDKVKAWRRIELAYLKAERHDLEITCKEQKFYSKLATALFRAQVEWQ